MADWVIGLNHFPADAEPVQHSVTVENSTRNLAIPLGMTELFKWCAEETPCPIPAKAIEFWDDCKRNGNVLLTEIQTRLEGEWGVTFEIKEATSNGAVSEPRRRKEPTPSPANGKEAVPVPEIPDLTTQLGQRLHYLQEREKYLAREMERIREQHDYIDDQVQETMALLTAIGMRNKKRRGKKDAETQPG